MFPVTVADVQGLSYYADRTTSHRPDMDTHCLAQARQELVQNGLIAYKKPLYQVLSLDTHDSAPTREKAPLQPLGQILKLIAEDAT